MAVVMEYQSGNCKIIVLDDDIEDMEEQERLLRHASSVVINADYRRYIEERKRMMEECKTKQGSET